MFIVCFIKLLWLTITLTVWLGAEALWAGEKLDPWGDIVVSAVGRWVSGARRIGKTALVGLD